MARKRQTSTLQRTVHLRPSTVDGIEAVAKQEHRSFSNATDILLSRALTKKAPGADTPEARS